MQLLWVGLLGLSRQDSRTPAVVLVVLLLHVVYLIAVYFSLKSQWVPPVWLVLAAAFAFRATMAPMAPVLTDDLFRYQWEGRIQTEGLNPYATRPADTGDPNVPGRDFKAVYGPLTEFSQRVAYSGSGGHLAAMKTPAMAADAATLLLLAWAAPGAALIYAWSPVPVLEFWGQGHNDAIALFFVTAALLLPHAGVWLGLAAAAKWWPLVLLPALARSWRDWLWAGAIPVVLMVPFLDGISIENLRFTTGFLGGWRNNDLGYGALLALTGDQYRAKHLAFAILGIAAIGVRWMPWPRERKGLAVVLAMLAVSANVHPWYLSWTLPFLVFYPVPWVFLWSALMPIAYETAIRWTILGEWAQSPEIRWLIYLPVVGMAFWSLVRHAKRPLNAPA
jgi:alpha-1,6-mannosyltransferase